MVSYGLNPDEKNRFIELIYKRTPLTPEEDREFDLLNKKERWARIKISAKRLLIFAGVVGLGFFFNYCGGILEGVSFVMIFLGFIIFIISCSI